MNRKVLVLALLMPVGLAVAQTAPAPSGDTDELSRTPVTYDPQKAPPPVAPPAKLAPVSAPETPAIVESTIDLTTVSPPRAPEIYNPEGPTAVESPSVPTNKYGPSTPSSDRLSVTPMVGSGPPPPGTQPAPPPSGAAPRPPTCDKDCY